MLRRNFGMPDIDESTVNQMFSQVAPLVSSMKNDDLFRRKQLMEFQKSLQDRMSPQEQFDFTRSRFPTTRGPGAEKPRQFNTVYAPPTAMQQQIAQERVKGPGPGALAAQNAEKLNIASMAAKERTEAEQRDIANALNMKREDRAYAEETAARRRTEKLTDDKTERDFKTREAQDARNDKGWTTLNRADPNDPTKQITIRVNNATGEVKPVTMDGQAVSGVTKPGTKLIGGVPEKDLTSIRSDAQSVLDELDEMLDDKGELKNHISDAVGIKRLIGAHKISGTEAARGDAAINTLKSKLLIDMIGKMKAQSKTGATGFGAMNLKELGVLESSIGKLDPNMPDTAFKAELNKIRDRIRQVVSDNADETAEKGKKRNVQEIMKRNGYKL